MTGAAPAVKSPYPGLRPFEAEDSDLFFGREPQIDELLRRLGRFRFVAVIGSSGSGKSSLVRAGLVPALVGGLLPEAGSHWRIAVFRPGGDPLGALTNALCSTLYPPEAQEASRRDLIEITLRRSSLGLVEAVRQAYLREHENLLVIVDQFEELFRFHQTTSRSPEALDRAAALVKLLIEATRQSEIPIHVLITMRSDFLGDCSQFRDLPETINEGLYLIPRMTRDQFRQAITGPALVCDQTVSPQLVQQLLNDLNNDADQLPVLQHALTRAWNKWRSRPGESTVLDRQQYLDIGGMAEALSLHADEAWNELEESDRKIAERLFQCLTERGPDNREIRRPTTLGQISRILDVDLNSVKRVIERFREEDRAFLTPSRLIPLDENSVIDISHESLIRKWDRLRDWVDKEARSRAMYLRLAEAARLNRTNEAGLWRNPDVQFAVDWKEQARPNEAWAQPYDPDFALAMDFLARSVADVRADEMRAAKQRRAEMERTRNRIVAVLVVVVIAAACFGWLLVKNRKMLKETMASRLATEAALLQTQNDWAIEESLLLAMESMRSIPSSLSDEIARNGLALLPKLVLRKEYQDELGVVAFSPDGELLASGGRDGSSRVLEVATQKEVDLPKQTRRILAMAFAPNVGARRLALGDDDGAALLMEADSQTGDWKQIARVFHEDSSVNALAFSPDGRYLATANSDGTACVIDTATGKEITRLAHGPGSSEDHGTRVVAVAFSPNGRFVATGSYDHTARVMRAATGQQIWQVKTGGSVFGVAFSHNGRFVAIAGQDGAARVLDAATGRELSALQHDKAVNVVAFSPDDKYLATASGDFTARIMNAATGKEIARLKHQGIVHDVAFYPDGRFIATASDDLTARVMEVATGREVSRIGHHGAVHAVAVAPTGRYVATASADGSVRIVSDTTRKATLTYDIGKVNVVAIAPDGSYVAIAGDDRDGSIHVYDMRSEHKGREIAAIPRQPDVNDAAFSADGRYLAWGSGQRASLFDIGAGKSIARQFPHEDTIYAVALSAKGRYLAIGGDSEGKAAGSPRPIEVLDPVTGRELFRLEHKDRVLAIAFSQDERFLATGSADATSAVYDLSSGRFVSRYTHQDQVNSVAFSPDARYVAVGCADGMLRVLEAATGREVSRYTHSSAINAVAFSPDGKYVATANQDATARIFEASTGREVSLMRHLDPVIAVKFISRDATTLQTFAGNGLYEHNLKINDVFKQACSQLSRNLTSEEWSQHVPQEPYRLTCANLPSEPELERVRSRWRALRDAK